MFLVLHSRQNVWPWTAVQRQRLVYIQTLLGVVGGGSVIFSWGDETSLSPNRTKTDSVCVMNVLGSAVALAWSFAEAVKLIVSLRSRPERGLSRLTRYERAQFVATALGENVALLGTLLWNITAVLCYSYDFVDKASSKCVTLFEDSNFFEGPCKVRSMTEFDTFVSRCRSNGGSKADCDFQEPKVWSVTMSVMSVALALNIIVTFSTARVIQLVNRHKNKREYSVAKQRRSAKKYTSAEVLRRSQMSVISVGLLDAEQVSSNGSLVSTESSKMNLNSTISMDTRMMASAVLV